MNFRLFGIDVEVQASFWLTTVLLGVSFLGLPQSPAEAAPLFVWALVVLVSVLVHEYGHAFAIRRHRIQPEIELYYLGGRTMWRALLPLRRPDFIIISLAGPFAGFLFAAVIFGANYALQKYAPGVAMRIPPLGKQAIRMLLYVNVYWGLFNLIPVLPFDGGHVLEHALGPKRVKLAAAISMIVGFGIALYALKEQQYWTAMIVGMSAYQSMRYLQSLSPDVDTNDVRPEAPPPDAEPPLTGELLSLLSRARQAIADDDLDKARTLAQQILARPDTEEEPLPKRARREALEILAWAAYLADDTEEAARKVAEAKKLGEVDPALIGAIHFARRELAQARRILEAARAAGDDRKEIVGPLVQILIEQGEIARAAAVAYDIADSLSEDDARRMAKLAFEGRAFDWSARLYEVVFERRKEPEDAYEATRAHAQDGAYDRAIEMLRKAVEAGFSDPTRVWSDAALETLRARSSLETLVPRP